MKNHKMLLGVTFALSALIGCQKQDELLADNFSESEIVDASTSLPDSTLPTTAAAVAAGSKRILIDLGTVTTGKDSWGKYWNSMTDARPGVRVSNAVTTLNVPTTLKVEVVNPAGTSVATDNNLRTSGANPAAVANDYPATATGDNAVVQSIVSSGKWKISGLTKTSSYYIRFWGTYKGAGTRNVQVKRADQTAWQEFNSSNNTDTAKAAKFLLTGKTDQEFNIQVKSGTNFAYINVIDITEYPAAGTTPGGTTNKTPTANAGSDATISLPTSSVTLKGSGTDPDGTITSYAWTKTAGPTQFTLSNAAVASPVLSGLVAGNYTFRLTVKDNGGATATDDVNINVNAAATGGGGKAHTLAFKSNGDAYYPTGAGLNWAPGDTVYVNAGTYHLIDLGNIRGTAAKPIIIMNKGGVVNVGQVRFGNKMEHFKFLGNGVAGTTYGFRILNNDNNIGLAAGLVSNMEVAYVEVAKAATGFMVKKNPVAGDATTQLGYYRINGVKIHHNYLHDITYEGMYIGNTSPSGTSAGIPIRLENVEIYNNRLERIGWDGIQMSCTIGTNSIHDNTVNNFGTANMEAQRTGIAIGSAATGDMYNNTITNGTGWGINAMGYGLMKIYNNTIVSVGANGVGTGSESIYADDRIAGPEVFPKQQIQVTNNTIRLPQQRGAVRIGAYNKNSLPSTITGNKIYFSLAPSNWLNLNFISNAAGSVISGNILLLQ